MPMGAEGTVGVRTHDPEALLLPVSVSSVSSVVKEHSLPVYTAGDARRVVSRGHRRRGPGRAFVRTGAGRFGPARAGSGKGRDPGQENLRWRADRQGVARGGLRSWPAVDRDSRR